MTNHNYEQISQTRLPAFGRETESLEPGRTVTHFETTIEIQAPPDRIWAAMRDIERWSEWTPSVIDIRLLDHGPIAVGTRAMVRQPKLLPAIWTITNFEEGRSFTWITRGPGLRVTARHSIERAANHSRVMLSLDFSGLLGSVFARLTRDLNARYLDLEARGLKEYAESGRPGNQR
ncbi:MAG TPA: SRPBCC family protein [Bryobacteraceae bacterium]|nr:SRPBCC family protein [Bryobacteraceae bacterium]